MVMSAIEFMTELGVSPQLNIPSEIAARLPKSGMARIIVIPDCDTGDSDWQAGAYQQFLRDDSPEDSIYASCHRIGVGFEYQCK